MANVVLNDEIENWSKSLVNMPTVTINEIKLHRDKSGKSKAGPVLRTLDRGRKLKEERYVTADSIFTNFKDDIFYVKAASKASMKNEFRQIRLSLNSKGEVIDATCSCPTGLVGYCNHVMALLFELVDYSTNELKEVPEEIACTSKLRQWGIPGKKNTTKEPVMNLTIHKQYDKKGISCTLYDPRINKSRVNIEDRFQSLATNLKSIDKRIGFAHCHDPNQTAIKRTKYGNFQIGSILSYQLAPNESNIEYITNITSIPQSFASNITHKKLPLKFYSQDHDAYPREWQLNVGEINFIKTLIISNEDSHRIEQETIKQGLCESWFIYRKYRITSSKAHLVATRKRQFEPLVVKLLNPKPKASLPKVVQDALNHGIIYESVAREKYTNVLKHELGRNINVRETGLVIQPNLFWVGASPDGMVIDDNEGDGLIEIKCPKSKVSWTPEALINDDKFYITSDNGTLSLKKDHEYYTQIQVAMGLSGAQFCDFIVYTFRGLIILRINYDEAYFLDIMKKINSFYRSYMLPYLVANDAISGDGS